MAKYSVETLWKGEEFVLSRRAWDDGRSSLLVSTPVSAQPAAESVARLNHAYSLRDELHSSWAAKPLALESRNGTSALLIEDPGGDVLAKMIGTPWELTSFLYVAISLAASLGQLHRCGIIHKDVKPSNVLVDIDTRSVWLVGFGIASRLPRERRAPEPPEIIAGTLAYMAPEQTGRMNRSIDARSDLYSLGITLYEMLTGTLPFTGSDPMEWIHCHIARQPAPLDERVTGIPAPVASIVMKLLAKTVEERYQTGAGVESDLRRCLAEWELHGRIRPLALGEDDTPDRLLIPEKLYGRSREVDTLLASFDRIVRSGEPELVLVSGYSGIGKSAVVNELHKSLVPPRGLFASGKFDQYKRDIPYATLAQAFQSLVRSLLGKTEAELNKWRNALCEALEPHGQLMVALVPELKAVVGEQPPVPELPQQEAKRRFHLLFRRFINVFARLEHPLALFLDDLQWLDAATLDLLEDLLTQPDVKHLMLIGAYRDNEVTANHPLIQKLEIIKRTGGKVTEITLVPLAREHLGQLIADALRGEIGQVLPLARLVHEKTGGNPFFAIQFISTLVDEGMLAFDHVVRHWSWDLDRIYARGYTDNVVDLMVGRFSRLPAKTQKALQQLACLGSSAEVTRIAIALEVSEEQVQAALYPAVQQELLERLADGYRFVHDRVREGAYSLIPDELRDEAHLRLGRLLVAHLVPAKREEAIFDIVNQLNRGSALITLAEEREQLAEFNLLAAKRAKGSTAYASALKYLIAGTALLPVHPWTGRHNLAFELELIRAECEFLTGALKDADERLTVLLERAVNMTERATIACLHIDVCTALARSDRAVVVALECLRHVGIQWSQHPTREQARWEYDQIWSHLGSRAIEDVIDSPLMTAPEPLATMEVLIKLMPSAVFTDRNLLCLTVCRMVSLSLECGNCDASCFGYVTLGSIAGPHFGEYQVGFRFGELGPELVERRGLKRFEGRICLNFANFVERWRSHVRNGRDLVHRAFEISNRNGDLAYAAFCCNGLITNLLAAGDPLAEVQREAEARLEFVTSIRFGLVMDIINVQLGLVRTLRGLTRKPGRFDVGQFDESQFERHLASKPALAIAECWYWVRKLQVRYLAGDYAAALDASTNAKRLLWTSTAFFEEAEFRFYSALSCAACCEPGSADGRVNYLDDLATHQIQLDIWAANCPETFENRAALVRAEIARIEGRDIDAMRLYERAIESAHANGFVHNEALANEVAARFYMARGFEKIAHTYLRDARHGYLRWGADGKVQQLDTMYPWLKTEEPEPALRSTIAAPVEHLDLATVIKVSQAVTGEMVLEKLIESLMLTAVEHAGAERATLILSHPDGLQVAAEATTSGDTVIVTPREASTTAAALPESIVHYVFRAQESVLLNDASAENQFSDDAYVRQHRARSILCLPLVHRAKPSGILYLENNLASHVFTPARMAALELLASQAAISLENARLYRDAQQMEAYLKAAQTLSHTGSFGWRLATREIVWSDETYQIIGYDRATKPTIDLVLQRIHPEDAASVQEVLDRATLGGTDLDFKHRFLMPDGSIKSVHVMAHAVKDENSKVVEYVGALMDITERTQAEDALRKSQGELAHVARVMTMGELVASIAHEVNQPLASVVNSASACLRWLDAERLEEARRSASRAIAEGHRASEIIGRIRALAKKAPPQKDWLDVNEMIHEVIELARGEIQRNGVALETQFSEDLPIILADRVQLQQVILNLMMNAVEAMNGVGEGQRELLIRSASDKREHLIISVHDSGPGLEPANLEHLFVAFHTTKPHGLGMGLSISRSIIQAHGGRLWAGANAPRGAVFQFTLPIGGERE